MFVQFDPTKHRRALSRPDSSYSSMAGQDNDGGGGGMGSDASNAPPEYQSLQHRGLTVRPPSPSEHAPLDMLMQKLKSVEQHRSSSQQSKGSTSACEQSLPAAVDMTTILSEPPSDVRVWRGPLPQAVALVEFMQRRHARAREGGGVPLFARCKCTGAQLYPPTKPIPTFTLQFTLVDEAKGASKHWDVQAASDVFERFLAPQTYMPKLMKCKQGQLHLKRRLQRLQKQVKSNKALICRLELAKESKGYPTMLSIAYAPKQEAGAADRKPPQTSVARTMQDASRSGEYDEPHFSSGLRPKRATNQALRQHGSQARSRRGVQRSDSSAISTTKGIEGQEASINAYMQNLQ